MSPARSVAVSEPARRSHRDVAAFDLRAASYEDGWRAQLHREITTRTAALAAREARAPSRILDVGCGTGQLLRLLASKFPTARELRGLDPAPSMLAFATTHVEDPRLSFDAGDAEHLPYPDGHFDLVVTTTSFDHWSDQAAGLQQCARVLDNGGLFVLVDLFSLLLAPTLLGQRRHKARTKGRVGPLLDAAGLSQPVWHDLYTPIIKAVTACRAR